MTDRLYYNDPYSREFDATVVGVEARESHTVVFLDRSLFYPTSGGQPFDTGTLNGLPVVDVFDDEQGRVGHVVEAPAGALRAAERVHGVVDWDRRFDHMQQHTGQHVLSAVFERLSGARTVSFHLGATASSIDLAKPIDASEIAAAEQEANHVVWEDRAVGIRYVTAEEAAALPLRKEPSRGGTLRLIEVEGVDLSACGGTHVARTGGIGVIAISAWERFKGGQRVEFLCGGRALLRFRAMRDASSSAVRLLSVLPEEIPGAIERLQADAKEHKRLLASLQTDLAVFRAAEFVAAAEACEGGRVIVRSIDADAVALQTIASAIVSRPGLIVALASTASPGTVLVARSADVKMSARAVVATLIGRLGGRGGGRDDFAQVGGLTADSVVILDTLRSIIQGSFEIPHP